MKFGKKLTLLWNLEEFKHNLEEIRWKIVKDIIWMSLQPVLMSTKSKFVVGPSPTSGPKWPSDVPVRKAPLHLRVALLWCSDGFAEFYSALELVLQRPGLAWWFSCILLCPGGGSATFGVAWWFSCIYSALEVVFLSAIYTPSLLVIQYFLSIPSSVHVKREIRG